MKPSEKGLTVTLRDGRLLAYMEYNCPDSNGKCHPVLL